MKLLCIFFGHDDPVMDGRGIISRDKLYENWKTWERNCTRCGKDMKPREEKV